MKPQIIRITKQFHFESAHALWGYDGACRNIHGHSYTLFVTLSGYPEARPDHPKSGMVMDFSILKKIIHQQIIDEFDHALLINKKAALTEQINPELLGKIVELDYQPTCENMLIDFAGRIISQLPDGIRLHSLKLHETATSFAEWYAVDN